MATVHSETSVGAVSSGDEWFAVRSYFDGESGDLATNFYDEVRALVTPSAMVYALVVVYVIEQVTVLATMGLGVWGNSTTYAVGVSVPTFGTLFGIYREDVHGVLLKPGSRMFKIASFAYVVFYAIGYAGKESAVELAPYDDDADYEAPFQPGAARLFLCHTSNRTCWLRGVV